MTIIMALLLHVRSLHYNVIITQLIPVIIVIMDHYYALLPVMTVIMDPLLQ